MTECAICGNTGRFMPPGASRPTDVMACPRCTPAPAVEWLHGAIDAALEALGAPGANNYERVQAAGLILSSARGELRHKRFHVCTVDGKMCLWGPCPPARCRQRVSLETKPEDL